MDVRIPEKLLETENENTGLKNENQRLLYELENLKKENKFEHEELKEIILTSNERLKNLESRIKELEFRINYSSEKSMSILSPAHDVKLNTTENANDPGKMANIILDDNEPVGKRCPSDTSPAYGREFETRDYL